MLGWNVSVRLVGMNSSQLFYAVYLCSDNDALNRASTGYLLGPKSKSIVQAPNNE